MRLYSLESPRSIERVSGKILVPDTSYLIHLANRNEEFHNIVNEFHTNALNTSSEFYINVVIRHEFLRYLRSAELIRVLMILNREDSFIKDIHQYSKIEDIDEFIRTNSEYIYKQYLKKGQCQRVINKMRYDIWDEICKFEKAHELEYLSGSTGDAWPNLGKVIMEYCLEPTDAMIYNFASSIDAEVIVTCDVGYANLNKKIDVYMPNRLAVQCNGIYDESCDL